jgi:murein endopeptidase
MAGVRRVLLVAVLGLVPLVAGAVAARGDDDTTPLPQTAPSPAYAPIVWHHSHALGKPWRGRLVRAVQLPREGDDFFTWDPVRNRVPNRSWRRWATDRLVRMVLSVLGEYRITNSRAPRVGIGDLSRRHGGIFDERFGGLGHSSHQNGLDADVYYPRLDGHERRAGRVRQIDLELTQDLVDRFVAAGAQYVFVGPHTGLTGPRKVVIPLRFHDDHMHVRVR